MSQVKKHKRSGSYVVHPAPSPGVMRSSGKKRYKNAVHGKFQAPAKPKVEKKNFDLATASLPTTLPSVATVTGVLLNAYSAGTTANGAIGRRVLNKSILLRMSVQPQVVTATGSVHPTVCRVAVVYDREANGAAPTISDVWGTGAAQGTCAAANLDNADRFSIVLDEKFVVGGVAQPTTATAAPWPAGYYLDRYVKLSLESVAKGGSFTGAITGIATGSLYLFAWSDIAAANNPPTVDASLSRVRFQDG